MIRTKLIEDQLRRGRLDAKTLDSMFRRPIEAGTNRSHFVSQAILTAVKEVFAMGPEDADHQLGLGQIRLLVVAAEDPAGKPLEECQKVSVLLSLEAGPEDYQVRLAHSVEGLRRCRTLRVTAEAREQGGLLSYEDLAFRLAISCRPSFLASSGPRSPSCSRTRSMNCARASTRSREMGHHGRMLSSINESRSAAAPAFESFCSSDGSHTSSTEQYGLLFSSFCLGQQ